MKHLSEVNCLTIDYGTFTGIAEMMAPHVASSGFYSPFESEYLDLSTCCLGDGLTTVTRIDDYMDPDVLKDIDLFIFPDRGYPGIQKYLRSIGKAVWGSFGVCELEESRTKFLDVLKELGLPVLPSVRIKGLTALAEHLKSVENKWVKVNRFRSNIETFHHIDYDHTARILDGLRFEFGPLADWVTFVVQDPLDGDEEDPVLEIGYDGWSVDGQFPKSNFSGVEAKNELYIGCELPYEEASECIKTVNEAFSSVLKSEGYRNFFATEIRKKGDKEFFIDPTTRHAGQTQEHLWTTCTNLADVIWKGANGELVIPEFSHKVAMEATLHYKDDTKDGWRTLNIPEELRDRIRLYHYCKYRGLYHLPPGRNDEVGVACSNGDTIEEAFDNLKSLIDEISGEPVKAELKSFADLIKQLEDAEEFGVEISKSPTPSPEIVLE